MFIISVLLGFAAFIMIMAACARSSQMSQEDLVFFAQLADESAS